jgi:GTP cyclohydrolase I
MSIFATTFYMREASTPVHSRLKRPDEHHGTMAAFDNPVFNEDVVCTASKFLKKDHCIQCFEVHAIIQEGVHNHPAFVLVSSG